MVIKRKEIKKKEVPKKKAAAAPAVAAFTAPEQQDEVIEGGPPPPPPTIKAATGSATAVGGTGGGRLAAKAETRGAGAQVSAVAGQGSAGVASPGTAQQTTTVKGEIGLGAMIEKAMENAIKEIQAESEALWNSKADDAADQIAALNDPANVRARMMEARAKVKVDWDTAMVASRKP
jgi:hypothetical protein